MIEDKIAARINLFHSQQMDSAMRGSKKSFNSFFITAVAASILALVGTTA